jgi:MFS family permease
MSRPPTEPEPISTAAPAQSAESSRAASTPRRLLAAGLIGSSIEWYDFFIYGTAAALVFPTVFFPEVSALTGALLSFSTFWAGFIARPLGGIVAGHYGDKYGRKPTVVACLIGMGVATMLIGCLPGASTLGAVAPVLLVILRFAQGLACGGQWGGIVLLLTESADPKRRGFAGTFSQMGVPLGVILGNLAFLAATSALSDEEFFNWGWRIPFLLSVLLFPVVLYIHTRVEDTPEFKRLQEAAANNPDLHVAQAPLSESIRRHWRLILLGCALLAASNSLFYISITGILSYGTTALEMSRDSVLQAILLSSCIFVVAILLAGHASDRLGRRPVVLTGAVLIALWAFPFFWLINTASLPLLFVACAFGCVFMGLCYGPLAAFLGELFPPDVRYSGASLAYQLAAITISGATPLIMTAIIAETGSTALVSVFIAVMAATTFFGAWKLQETNPASVRNDPAAVPGSTHPDSCG